MFIAIQNHFEPFPHDFACQRWLFNEPEHLKTQNPFKEVWTFLWLKGDTIHARFNAFFEKNEVKSPLRATFGGIETVLEEKELRIFINSILDFLLKKGISQIQTITAPAIYFNQTKLNQVLREFGFEVLHKDLNFHIPISTASLKNRMTSAEKRRLKKCQYADFQFGINVVSLADVYAFISETRETQKIPLNISEQQLTLLFRNLHKRYTLFSVRYQNKLVACCVGVWVMSNVLYVFLPASAPEYQHFSPMVMLIERLYTYCQQENALFLDWGIATEHGERNEGLIRFKQNMGAVSTERITWQYLCS